MKLTRRQGVWSGVAALVAWAVLMQPRAPAEPGLVEAQVRRPLGPTAVGSALAAHKREPLPVSSRDPFAAVVMAPAPPPVAQAAVAVEPIRAVAPPLPFRFMARVKGVDGQQSVFVTRENRVIAVQPGEVVDEQYRVERLDAELIVFTYLPLQEQQSMPAR
jgi:hypothetical protein